MIRLIIKFVNMIKFLSCTMEERQKLKEKSKNREGCNLTDQTLDLFFRNY